MAVSGTLFRRALLVLRWEYAPSLVNLECTVSFGDGGFSLCHGRNFRRVEDAITSMIHVWKNRLNRLTFASGLTGFSEVIFVDFGGLSRPISLCSIRFASEICAAFGGFREHGFDLDGGVQARLCRCGWLLAGN